jgi:uncharacterized protein (DUF169 family)
MLGIAFLEEPYPAVRLTRRHRPHCTFMADALDGRPVQIERRSVSCPLARYYLGLDEGNIDAVVQFLMRSGDAEDEELAHLYLSSGWRLTELGPYMLYFRYPMDGVEPTVLIRAASAAELAPLVHAYGRRTGRRLLASVSGLGAACGECTVYPILTGLPNLSLGCRGCKRKMRLESNELLLATPHASPMFDIMVQEG